MKHKTIIAIAVLMVSGMLTGCAAQPDKKQAMVERWEKSAALAKLPTVETLITRGRIAEAENTLRQCLLADPASAQAHFLMGRVHLIEDRNDQARLSFTEAITLDASHDGAWYHLGVLFDLAGDSTQAMDAYRTALSIKPAEPDYIAAMARCYIQADQLEQAQELLEDRLKRQPRNRDLLLVMADLSRRSGQLENTAACYERILMSNAKDSEVLEALGYVYVALKDWNKATGTFEKLLSLVKEETQKESVLETLALCAFHAERYGQALRYYDRLSVVRRDDPEIWLNMAQAALGADMVERAAVIARRALQLKPSWPQAYAVLGATQYLQTNYDAAIRSFAYARSDNEVGGFAWFMTGRCYARLGQTGHAEAAYQRAGTLAGDSPLIERFLKERDDSL